MGFEHINKQRSWRHQTPKISHPHKMQLGDTLGWAIRRLPTGSIHVKINMVGEGTLWKDTYTVMDEEELGPLLDKFKFTCGRPRDRYYMMKRLRKETILW